MTRRETSLLVAMAAVVFAAVYVSSRPFREDPPVADIPSARWDSLPSSWTRGGAVIPDSMAVGVPATIRITTEHSDTCVRSGGTEIRVDDLIATIRPHDFVGSGMVCGAEVTSIVHETSITFYRAGVATIRVEGRSGAPLERRVVVR